jgi:CHAT domain-containing protein/tetratricopeptide (TPR) repeat protein
MMWPAAAVAIGLALGLAGRPAFARYAEPGLVPGSFTESTLPVSGSVRHPLALEAGAFVHVDVRELGPRTVLTLLDAGGGVVARREPPAEFVTSYRLLAVAPSAGSYTLEVRAHARDGPGRHAIQLDAARPATDRDRALAAADAALAEGSRLAGEGAAARAQALERLQAAESGFREAGDTRGQAIALRDRGIVLDGAGSEGAPAAFDAALRLFESLGDAAGQATALNGLARVRYRRGEREAALALHERAAALAEGAGDRRALANYVIAAGVILDHRGWSEKAIDYYTRGLALATAAGSRRAEGRAVNNLGVAYQNLGEQAKALAFFQRAVELQRAAGSRLGEVIALGNVSNTQHALDESALAAATSEEALRLARAAELPEEEAWLLKNASRVHRALGDHTKAVEAARQALALWPESAERAGKAEALSSLGRALDSFGDRQAAAETLRASADLAAQIGERFLQAEALLALAQTERDLGRLRDAVQHAQECIALTEALRGAMTNPELRGSFQAAEEDKYGVLIDLLMRFHEQEPSAGHDAAALQVSEQARGRLLLEALIEARADIREGVEPELLERERSLQRRLSETTDPGELEKLREQYGDVEKSIRNRSPRYAALMQPVPASLEDIRRHVVDAGTVALEFYLGDHGSFLWAVTPDAFIARRLPRRQEVEAAARRVHELLTERQRGRTPAAVHKADMDLSEASRRLSAMLLGDVGPRLDGEWKGRRLLIVASGAVAYLPFGALPSPAGAALVAGHEIVYAPSASFLVALRQGAAEERAGTKVAVLADPVFEASDPRVARGAVEPAAPGPASVGLLRALGSAGGRFRRLPFSRLEAREIASLVAPGSLLNATDFAAARPLATEGALRDRRIIHIATHGLLNTEHPDLSGLVLSLVDRKGAPQDGFLRMQDIYNLRLQTDLVVLSACQTALGREIRGEGLVGLTRGFMYAGARAVVASLWQVDDESTAELMKRFYRGMLKEDRRPADALRQAQLEMSRTRRWSAPFYWAGFVLQGEWR